MASRFVPSASNLPALTGLRGVAALWVVLFHVQFSVNVLGLPLWFRTGLLLHGWVAVDIFFILSGFVLMHTHGCDFASIRAEAVRRFALQRVLRVYPTATAALLLVVVLTSLDPAFVAYRQQSDPTDYTIGPFLRTLTLTGEWFPQVGDWNAPTWSLSVEIVGYAAFPWLARMLSETKRPAMALSAGVICVFGLAWLNAISGRIDYNDIGGWAFARMGFCFVGGACLARFHGLAADRLSAAAGPIAIMGAAWLWCACTIPGLMILVLPSSAALVLALALGGGPIGALLSTPPVLWLGRISFPLYLVHLPPLLWLTYCNRSAHLSGTASWAMLGAYLILCLLLADRLHRFVELPSQRLARRLTHGVGPADGRRSAASPEQFDRQTETFAAKMKPTGAAPL